MALPALLGEATYALIRMNGSSIADLIPDITIEEQHRDETAITRHPVEGGAVITDHAYMLPAELEVKVGYSNSTGGSEGYVQQSYEAFLALQNKRQPFSVYTDKRRYQNMLVRGLSTVTDEKNKNILVLTVSLQQLLIVSTQSTGGGDSSSTTSPASEASNQSQPSATQDIENRGAQAGVGVGNQSFAGSFGPGYSTAASGGFDLSGGPGAGTAGGGISLEGTSPAAAEGSLGPMIETNTGVQLQPAEPNFPQSPPLNVFSAGNPGF